MNKWFASLVVSVVALTSCQSTTSAPQARPASAPHNEVKNVGILIFDGLFITEFVAPFDIYKHVGDKMNVFTVAPSKASIKCYEGVVLQPDYAWNEAPRIDVLVVPSGINSTSTDLDNRELVGFVQRTAQGADMVTSHCWGAFTLAKAGCLDGRESTTFPSSIDDLQAKFPNTKTRKNERFVVSGKYVSSNGGLAASEAALYVVEQMYGKETADKVAEGLVFAPQNRKYASDPSVR
jgi:transcriptional regulator GlxA family with amidase domain